ncbi:MAG: hypothetical protein ACFFCS_26160 [Candidatus Hodarchaeota archaeon]
MENDCKRCGEKKASYLVTINTGDEIVKEYLCFGCYRKAQNERIIDVDILKH